MTDDETAPTKSRPDLQDYPAEKARQGEIILRRPWQRAAFIVGLIGIGVLALAGCAVWIALGA